ncbi:unnamed protein product [Prunus armeniaca]|uniref:Uncharacterized protein n=1 Tax=Prunus armeniaca TaxID=36596 RepID=A0A6J5WXN4_PRUAR|nr:unnamed protein product [Prunus armeniaca]
MLVLFNYSVSYLKQEHDLGLQIFMVIKFLDSCDRISELPRNTIVIQAQKAERDAQIYKLRVCGRREIAHTPNNNLMK